MTEQREDATPREEATEERVEDLEPGVDEQSDVAAGAAAATKRIKVDTTISPLPK